MTILTSVTGFFFPIHGFTPALAVGAVSLVILLIALVALYGKHLSGAWRWIYVVTAVTALWFNVFVLIVQSFEKVLVAESTGAAGWAAISPNRKILILWSRKSWRWSSSSSLGIAAALRFRPGPAISA